MAKEWRLLTRRSARTTSLQLLRVDSATRMSATLVSTSIFAFRMALVRAIIMRSRSSSKRNTTQENSMLSYLCLVTVISLVAALILAIFPRVRLARVTVMQQRHDYFQD